MKPNEVLERVPSLGREQLSYYAQAGYISPKKHKRGKNEYNDYSENDLLVIEKAFYYIQTFDTKTKAAFQRARKELKQPQLKL